VQHPKPIRSTEREVTNFEKMAAEAETAAENEDGGLIEIEYEVMAEDMAEGTAKGKAVVEKDEEKEGKTMKFNEDWVKEYTKDLIIPESGLPSDLISGIIRVVDGKQYRLDDYG
jgi:hypothetical protein